MRTFTRTEIIRYGTNERTGYVAPRGQWSIPFEVQSSAEPVCHRLRLIGETDYFWRWRTEWGAPYAISMAVDDALTKGDTYDEAYALEFPCRLDDTPRNAYVKLFGEDLKPGKPCVLSLAVKGTAFQCVGEAGLTLELYFAKEGRHPNDVYDAPDQLVTLDFPQGTYDWTVLRREFTMPANAVCGILRLGVRNCTGAVKTGSPRLIFADGENIVPCLAPTQDRLTRFNYLGENLSRRDWLECSVKVDGKEIFCGEKYSCIVRRPEYTFEAGTLAPGKHIFTLELRNDYMTAIGFVVQGLELHTLGNHDFELIGAPETVPEGEAYSALIRTTSPNVTVIADGISQVFGEPGLHALEFPPMTCAEQRVEVVSMQSGFREEFRVERVGKPDRPAYLGTGDFVYIPHTQEDMERYLEWYVANHVGNCVCFRHSYRWGGSRSMNAAMWKKTIPLLNALRLEYTLMVDGREVPGMNSSPTEELLQGPYYLGRRSHENDGSFCYWANHIWGRTEVPEPYGDILSRGVNPGGIQPHVRPKRNGEKVWWFFDPEKAQDMKEAAEYFVSNLSEAKAQSTRHSGPSTLFRYFFQAGYDCLLAEQMYAPEEVILAALRGATRAYRREDFGTHLAVQWGSSPLDTQEHADRYFLSLATSYLNGATDINTEEGLWRMESKYADYDRFSHNCRIHQHANDRFRRFLERNPRKGRLVVPNAVIQGRYDGWRCFGRGNVWCNLGEEWAFGKPEESFDLLQAFFPRSCFDSIVCDGQIHPQGWYTGMPYGMVDLMPWEGGWNSYGAIAMMGWHTYEPGDGEKMLEYVRQGGRLLLCRRHLNTALKRGAAPVYPVQDAALAELLGEDWCQDGPMRARRIGRGVVRFFPTDLWPAEEPLRSEYRSAIRENALEASSEEESKGWILSNEDVEFAVYEQPDGTRVFYLLNIRWWDRQSSTVTLVKNGVKSEITVPFGEILVCGAC